MKRLFYLLVLATWCAPLSALDLPGPLVDGEWLADNHDGVHLLDVRKEITSFDRGHIPGAVLVDVNRIRIEREVDGKLLTRMRPDAKSFEAFMRAHGVNRDSLVVLTHRGETPGQLAGATRLYWHMKYFGFDRVALLDGGNPEWVAALEELVRDSTEVVAGDYVVGRENPDIVATMPQVRAALGNEAVTLIDTRGLRYHVGLDKKDYVYAYGHIPGSRNLPYQFLNPLKGSTRYFDAATYVALLDSLRIDLDNSLILYCNSAYECSSNWFVLHEILGKTDVRVYDGSLHQWTQYADNPMTARLTQ